MYRFLPYSCSAADLVNGGVFAGPFRTGDGAGKICSVSAEKYFETFRFGMIFQGFLVVDS
jgi:hypothetical protein